MKTDEELIAELEAEDRRHPVRRFLRNWGWTILIVAVMLLAYHSSICPQMPDLPTCDW